MTHEKILKDVRSDLEPLGFEAHPFKIGWYNECVDAKFQLNYHEDTFALLILNTPSTFEKLFLPFLFDNYMHKLSDLELLNDPIDACMAGRFEKLREKLVSNHIDSEIEIIKDYELTPLRRPKIVMQTCAHISGAAYYYDPKKLNLNDIKKENQSKNLMGCCIHPTYGGWCAFRAVFIFKNIVLKSDELKKVEPIDALNGDVRRIGDMLEKFNFNWKNSQYRDVIQVKEKYSPIQIEYFLLEPSKRKELIKNWLLNYSSVAQLCKFYSQKALENYMTSNFYFL